MSHDIELICEIAASPDRVFAAWTEPELVLAWWRDPEEFRTVAFESACREQGAWKVTFETLDGTRFSAGGDYRAIERPGRLGFTWKTSWDECAPTLVDLRFAPGGAGTVATIRHGGFETAGEAAENCDAWQSAFALLKAFLEKPD